MKLWTSSYLFKHTWETVTQALWRKYPNDLNPNVKAIDVVDRKVDMDGKLHTTRIISSNWTFPTFITQLLGMPDMCYAVEQIVVDPKTKTMSMKTVNITFSSVMEVEESIAYQVNPEDSTTTQMTQGAAINITGIAFKDYFEGLIANAFDANANKGRQAVEQVIAKISLENVIDTVTEQMQDLCVDLEKAKETVSLGFDEITSKLTNEFDEIKEKLNEELDGLALLLQGSSAVHTADINTISARGSVLLRMNSDSCSSPSLTAQVIDGGFTATR